MDILCDNSTTGNSSTTSDKDTARQHSRHTQPEPCVHYDFKIAAGDKFNNACSHRKELRESIIQWGMEGSLTVTQVQFSPSFRAHEERSFLRQLLAFAAEEEMGSSALSAPSIQSVEWEALTCTVLSMDFFDCLVDKGIVSESGDIRGCYDDTFDGVTASDRLRELLLNPDSDNADTFGPDQQRELLFHVFRALCIGGGVCQPDDRLEAYTKATKTLYKDLVSVQKNTSTGELEIAPCKVYRVTGTNGRNSVRLPPPPPRCTTASPDSAGNSYAARATPPTSSESPHDVCLVVVDLAKRRASVLRKEYSSFW